MDYTIYDVSEFVDVDAQDFDINEHNIEDLVELETGLSSGELRQAILDRFRQTVKHKDYQFVTLNFENHGLILDDEVSELESDYIVEDIDTILYDFEDEDLAGTVWILPQEVIYIFENEW